MDGPKQRPDEAPLLPRPALLLRSPCSGKQLVVKLETPKVGRLLAQPQRPPKGLVFSRTRRTVSSLAARLGQTRPDEGRLGPQSRLSLTSCGTAVEIDVFSRLGP